MTRVALKGSWGRKLRTVLTALAIVLGVAMISGTYILTDTITAAFTNVVDDSYSNADAVDQRQGRVQEHEQQHRGDAGVSRHRPRGGEAAAGRLCGGRLDRLMRRS